ncbi:MAG: response regulator transcription factor [Chitinophagaceae bacterium]|nr:response regulator transcription factor [Chitinophagaceae bacterium]
MKILIADDHAIFRKGLRDLLKDELTEACFEEAKNGEELFELAMQNNYDLIIADINMPGKSGLDCVKELKNLKLKTPILVLSMHNAIEYAVRTYRAGAFGFINKENDIATIVAAIKKILDGEKYFSEEVNEIIKKAKLKDVDKPLHQKLSDREFEIFKLLVSGLSPLEIAHKLELGKTTISTFKRRIFDKMELFSVSELTKYAVEAGLI